MQAIALRLAQFPKKVIGCKIGALFIESAANLNPMVDDLNFMSGD